MRLYLGSWLAALLLSAVTALPSSDISKRAGTECNGYSELCNRKYSNVTFVGTHDSYAVGSMETLGANQKNTVPQQLDDGMRVLQVQAHKMDDSEKDSGIFLCHTDCDIFNGGTMESFLGDVKSWIRANPNEVVTLIIANNDNLPATQFATAFGSTGLDKYAYKPGTARQSKTSWPTLQKMIDQKTNLVVFMDYKTNLKQVPYIIPEFNNVWENAFDQTSSPFNCTPDRFSGDTSQMMFLHNYFLDKESSIVGRTFVVPNVDKLNQTNTQKNIADSVDRCYKQQGTYPTFILLDFYDVTNDEPLQATAQMNNVPFKQLRVNETTPEKTASDNAAVIPHVPLLTIGAVLLFSLLISLI
ncbi:hypothetical protein MVES1_001157 [Malassezia vespertilionis]|uniref:uncharacterized protein n=1 Tax=Malassezia vespertilionis TaxID=2020962 RepID=UPI0024B21EE6|nr:uncharacterized protein MVES1_001157 [Malassezia vespertilionis]WFD05823.1 hypothetical protein MVES1_001157 [Malassezia vespertilionis]